MRSLRALVIYLVTVFIGGSLLAPWLWRLAQLAGYPALAQAPFHRFVDRSFLILALAGLWPLLRVLGATTGREMGLISPWGQGRRLAGGLGLGFGSLAALAALVLGGHERVWLHPLPAGKIAGSVLGAAGTAALVAGLEEILFRGGVFGGLRRILPWPTALGISSAIYALVHFLERAELAGPETVDSRVWPRTGRAAGAGLPTHGEPVFFHRPSCRLDFLAENLRGLHGGGDAGGGLVLGHGKND